jgi:DNA-binding transcriptional ArsR family regulator
VNHIGNHLEARQVDPKFIRPYVITRGRTRPTSGRFDLISMALTTGLVPGPGAGLHPEHLSILQLCRVPKSVAEIAADLDLPVATIRVLLADLYDQDLVSAQEPRSEADLRDVNLYKAVLNRLQSL